MTDDNAASNAKPVSMRKSTKQPATDVPRPRSVTALAAALALSGLAAVLAALTFYGEHDFLVKNLAKSQPKDKITTQTITKVATATSAGLTGALGAKTGSTLSATDITAAAATTVDAFRSALPSDNVTKNQRNDQADNVRSDVTDALKGVSGQLTAAQVSTQSSAVEKKVTADLTSMQKDQLDRKQIVNQANKIPTSTLVLSLFLFLALSFVAKGVYDGKFWGRWAVPAVWVLASFTGTPAGFTALLLLGSDLPVPYKGLSALSAAALTLGVVLAFLTPTRAWFEAHRPVLPAGAPQRRGLFAPRVPPPTGGTAPTGRGRAAATRRQNAADPTADPAPAAPRSGADRARAKKRVAAESARTGAEAARSRAKTASKSRRTES